MQCPYCAANLTGEHVVCPECRVSIEDGQPMKWYCFLVWIGLWIAGLGTLLLGILTTIGIPYLLQGYPPGAVYNNFPSLAVMDCVYGVLLMALGAAFIVTRFRLAAFKRNGPLLLYGSYALVILASVIYSAASARVVSGGTARLIGLPELSSVAGMIAGVALNVFYFRKRMHLFYH